MKTALNSFFIGMLALLLLGNHSAIAQVMQNGLILPASAKFDDVCCIYAPKSGFTVYDNPEGNVIGKLTRDVLENQGAEAQYRIYFVDNESKSTKQIARAGFAEVGYEVFSIAYFERRSGFVRVVNNNVTYWLSENEIQRSGFSVVEWQTFLSGNKDVLGYYANNPGLQLREAPTTEAKIMKTLRGDLYTISPTTEHQGNWTKVKVTKRKQHPCGSNLSEKQNIEFELEGWVKMVDDRGKPNVWFYSRGC